MVSGILLRYVLGIFDFGQLPYRSLKLFQAY